MANQVLHINTSSFDSPTCLEVRSQFWQLIAMIHQWKPVDVSKTHKAEGSFAQKMMDMVTFPETSLSHLPGSKAFFEKNAIVVFHSSSFVEMWHHKKLLVSGTGKPKLFSACIHWIHSLDPRWIPLKAPTSSNGLQTEACGWKGTRNFAKKDGL